MKEDDVFYTAEDKQDDHCGRLGPDYDKRSCHNCNWIDDVDGGSSEYGCPTYICQKNAGYGNLISFPFKKEMDCFNS